MPETPSSKSRTGFAGSLAAGLIFVVLGVVATGAVWDPYETSEPGGLDWAFAVLGVALVLYGVYAIVAAVKRRSSLR